MNHQTRVNYLSLKRLIAAEMLILCLCLWLFIALRPGTPAPMFDHGMMGLLSGIFLIASVPGSRLPHWNWSKLYLQGRQTAIVFLMSSGFMGVLQVVTGTGDHSTLFPMALAATLAGILLTSKLSRL